MTLKDQAAEVQVMVTALNEALASFELAGGMTKITRDLHPTDVGPQCVNQVVVGCYLNLCPPPPRRKQEELGI